MAAMTGVPVFVAVECVAARHSAGGILVSLELVVMS